MAVLLGHLTIKFYSIKFNSQGLLVRVCDGTQSNSESLYFEIFIIALPYHGIEHFNSKDSLSVN